MANDVTWWRRDTPDDHRHQNNRDQGTETPGDTDAADIVGRTGEEMPEVAHDEIDDAAPEGDPEGNPAH